MGPACVADEDLSLSFARNDDERRLELGRQLAGYVRRHSEQWDITAVLEPARDSGDPDSRAEDGTGQEDRT